MTYAILQVAAAAYDDVRARIVAIDERLRINEYVKTYIRPAEPGRPEHLVFGAVGLERLPEPALSPAAAILKAEMDAKREAQVATDAARWRALLQACPRLLGCAGVVFPEGEAPELNPKDNGYVHAGFEFWTQASPNYFTRGRDARAVLELLADRMIAQGGEAWAMVDGKRVETTPPVPDERG